MNYRLPVAGLLLALLPCARGELGATREQCDKLYGQPVAVRVRSEWSYPALSPTHLAGSATQVCVYAVGTNGAVAAFFRSQDEQLVCIAQYLTVRGPADQALKSFLKPPNSAVRWQDSAPAWKPKGIYKYRMYTRTDGKAQGYSMTRLLGGVETLEMALYDPARW